MLVLAMLKDFLMLILLFALGLTLPRFKSSGFKPLVCVEQESKVITGCAFLLLLVFNRNLFFFF